MAKATPRFEDMVNARGGGGMGGGMPTKKAPMAKKQPKKQQPQAPPAPGAPPMGPQGW